MVARQRLGNKAESTSPSKQELASRRRHIRRERHNLSRISRAIYAAEGAKQGLDYILNYHRSAKCEYVAHDDVDIKRSKKYGTSFFTGVVTCGNASTCPNCAAKIEERRRKEIAHAMDYFYRQYPKGYAVKTPRAFVITGIDRRLRPMQAAMITLTFSHKYCDRLIDLLEKQAEALEKFRSGKAWQKFKAVFGFEGLIRSLELTFGGSGYHPHTHELWFMDRDFDRAKIDSYLMAKFRAKKDHPYRNKLLKMHSEDVFKCLILDRWYYYCKKVGLMKGVKKADFYKYSVDVKHNARNSDYIAKNDDSKHWGTDREIAKSSTKEGKAKGVHPFAFLSKFDETKDGIWAARWLEYSEAFKGKSRVFWSQELKARVGVKDLTDAELAALKEDVADSIYSPTTPEWRRVRNNPALVKDTCEEITNKDVIKVVINSISGESQYERAASNEEALPVKDRICILSGEMIDEAIEPAFMKLKIKNKSNENSKPIKLKHLNMHGLKH